MRNRLFVFGLVMLGVVAVAFAQPKPAVRPPAAGPAATNPPGLAPVSPVAAAASPAVHSATQKADEQAIRQLVAAFAKAFNAGDAKAVAALFTADAETIDEDGTRSQGRAAIQEVFAEAFKAHPKSQIEIAVESIRFLSPILALEEGLSTVKPDPREAGESGRYSVTYVKQDGRWQMASAHDLADDQAKGSSELEQLGWLVGSWVDEDAEGLVKTNYQWTDNHHFLVGEFTLQVAGKPALAGTHRIGWDPLSKKIRSWVFDSEGGFGESVWTRDDDEWVVKMTGVTRDGRIGSATNVYTRLGPDKYAFSSRDRVFGDELSEGTDPVVVVREPPKPGKSSK
jgi:uncharacterized protein (TIGR02246 family)